jgi:uncharacterized protein (DUF1330 family)
VAAFVVFVREKTKDQSEMAAYTPKAQASLAGHAVTVHAACGRHEVLEGPEVEGVAIISFPTFEEAKAWYDSPAYREARDHRFKGADSRGIVVEGL